MPDISQAGRYGKYELYASCFEMDVVYTINGDLDEAAQQEKQEEMNYMQSVQKAAEKREEKQIDAIVDRML